MPPPVRGRGCDAQGRRGGPERRTALDQAHQLQPTLQAELAPTVLHVRPPSAGLSSQTAPSVGGRTPSYPFSKSVGSSSSRRFCGLIARGLVGVQLAISDAHAGLKAAI